MIGTKWKGYARGVGACDDIPVVVTQVGDVAVSQQPIAWQTMCAVPGEPVAQHWIDRLDAERRIDRTHC